MAITRMIFCGTVRARLVPRVVGRRELWACPLPLGGASGPSPPLPRLPRWLVTVAPKRKHLHKHRPVLRESGLISLVAIFFERCGVAAEKINT